MLFSLSKCEKFVWHCFFFQIFSILLNFNFFFFFRLWPVYGFVIFLSALVLPALSSGPLWYSNDPQNCKDYWWTNMLFIDNFHPKNSDKKVMKKYLYYIFEYVMWFTSNKNRKSWNSGNEKLSDIYVIRPGGCHFTMADILDIGSVK